MVLQSLSRFQNTKGKDIAKIVWAYSHQKYHIILNRFVVHSVYKYKSYWVHCSHIAFKKDMAKLCSELIVLWIVIHTIVVQGGKEGKAIFFPFTCCAIQRLFHCILRCNQYRSQLVFVITSSVSSSTFA